MWYMATPPVHAVHGHSIGSFLHAGARNSTTIGDPEEDRGCLRYIRCMAGSVGTSLHAHLSTGGTLDRDCIRFTRCSRRVLPGAPPTGVSREKSETAIYPVKPHDCDGEDGETHTLSPILHSPEKMSGGGLAIRRKQPCRIAVSEWFAVAVVVAVL